MQVESNSLKQDFGLTFLVLKNRNEQDDVAESSRPPRSALGELKANGGEIFSTPLVNTRYNQAPSGLNRSPGTVSRGTKMLVGSNMLLEQPLSRPLTDLLPGPSGRVAPPAEVAQSSTAMGCPDPKTALLLKDTSAATGRLPLSAGRPFGRCCFVLPQDFAPNTPNPH